MSDEERQGYRFWGPTVAFVLGVELLAALSKTFQDTIPWPTISETVGHLEKRWAWVTVLVVGLLSAVAFHALATRERTREEGRIVPEGGLHVWRQNWYTPTLVFVLTVAAFVLALLVGTSRLRLGYAIYGTLAVSGILIPSILALKSKLVRSRRSSSRSTAFAGGSTSWRSSWSPASRYLLFTWPSTPGRTSPASRPRTQA